MRKSPIPVYFQVKNDILDKIKNDTYKVGEKIPTDKEFCQLYDVSRITVRRALSELEMEGYIERIQGKGTFVKFKDIKQNISSFYSFTEETKKMGYIPSAIFLKLELVTPNEEVLEALELERDEKVFLLERLRLADEMIIAYDRSYMSEKLLPGFKKEMLIGGSLYNALEAHYGFRPDNSEETIEAIAVNPKDAMKMRMKSGEPALLVKRISKVDDRKVEFNYRIVNSTVYKYKLTLY